MTTHVLEEALFESETAYQSTTQETIGCAPRQRRARKSQERAKTWPLFPHGKGRNVNPVDVSFVAPGSARPCDAPLQRNPDQRFTRWIDDSSTYPFGDGHTHGVSDKFPPVTRAN